MAIQSWGDLWKNGNHQWNGHFSEYQRAASVVADSISHDKARAVVFASAWSAEGTTTMVLTVARLLTEIYGLRVLAMELNYDRPAFTRLFGLDDKKSLASIAAGAIAPEEAIQTVPAGFSVIPAGPEFGPSEWARLDDLLRKVMSPVENNYDAILIDSPAVLENAAASVLMKEVPRIVLVVEAGATSYDSLDRVQREAGAQGAALVGAILNKERRFMPKWLHRHLER